MGINRRQTRRDKPALTYWRNERVPNGTRVKGWVAGPVQFFNTHRVNHSKPCLDELTGGDLHCPWCNLVDVGWTGYLPMYSEHDERIFVVLHDDMKERAESLRLHQPIIAFRGKRVTAAIQLSLEAWTTRAHSALPDRQQPADIFLNLVQIWDVPELTAYVAKQPPDLMTGVSILPPTQDDGDELLTKGVGTAISDELRQRFRERMAGIRSDIEAEKASDPERNGTHKRKTK